MKALKLNFLLLLIAAVLLTLGLSLSLQSILAAWTAPSANPPTCAAGDPGCDAPLNAGPLVQTKGGGLWINTGGVSPYGLIVETGNVGIGTTTPTAAKLVVDGAVSASTPVNNSDLATKAYVDAQASSGGGAVLTTYGISTVSLSAPAAGQNAPACPTGWTQVYAGWAYIPLVSKYNSSGYINTVMSDLYCSASRWSEEENQNFNYDYGGGDLLGPASWSSYHTFRMGQAAQGEGWAWQERTCRVCVK